MKKYRVLHCPYNFAGNASNLVRAEKMVGLDSRCAVIEKTSFNYSFDEYFGSSNFFIREIKRWCLFIKVLLKYDIIHFNAGHSLMPDWSQIREIQNPIIRKLVHTYVRLFTLKDLPILKFFKKGIVVTYQGDDARQPDYCLQNFKITFAKDVSENYYNKSYQPYKKWKIEMFNRYADKIYATNPDLLYVLPKRARFFPYIQLMTDDWKPIYPEKSIKKPIVVHAPSNREVKGTKYILKAVERLKREGIPFKFILVENMSNKKAVEIYKEADILIDQLLAGWYGKLAVELMALGKPVMAYIREGDLKFIPPQMKRDLPIINTTPYSIYRVLKRYLTTGKPELQRLGKTSRKYVEKWHNSYVVAKRLLEEYKSIPLLNYS